MLLCMVAPVTEARAQLPMELYDQVARGDTILHSARHHDSFMLRVDAGGHDICQSLPDFACCAGDWGWYLVGNKVEFEI